LTNAVKTQHRRTGAGDKDLRLVAENLECVRGGRRVFSGLSFTCAAGEGLLLTGPNGSGKSSLLRLIAGLVQMRAGKLDLEGSDSELSIGQHTHYAGHLDALKTALTAYENLAFWASLYGGDPDEALTGFNLSHLSDIPAGFLSAGQKRRLGLARLFLGNRPLWLLDEPSVSLDAASRDILGGIMKAHMAGGGLLIAATHVTLGVEFTRELKLGVGEAAA